MALLNPIVRTVDKAAQQHGLEKARMLWSDYVASGRLVVPRVDHVTRCIDFAREVQSDSAILGSHHGLYLQVIPVGAGPCQWGSVFVLAPDGWLRA